MKIAALVTTLLIGASSAAMAAPSTSYAPEVRDHRTPEPYAPGIDHRMPQRPVAPARPTTLASNARLSRGHALIDVSSWKRFNSLELQAASGSMFVDKVVITFADGQTQVAEIDKQLGNGQSCATIDLAGRSRKIDKLVVYGRGGRRASLAITAS
jgi:hypothetical protein